MPALPLHDAIIVGGGPAGLSAALVLGRCRRDVVVFDTRQPRNAATGTMHGFLSRDGIAPGEFLQISREQLARYPGVQVHIEEVVAATRQQDAFTVRLRNGSEVRARLVLLATGLVDQLPDLPGVRQFYGQSVHHCPYCDGWERRDQALAVHGGRTASAELAIELRLWSRDLVICSDGPPEWTATDGERLARLGIGVREEPIAALEGEGGDMRGIRFADGTFLERQALFFSPFQWQHSPLAQSLGCRFNPEGLIECGTDTGTGVAGLYVAGNASHGLQLVIMAAAEGTQAAFSMNQALVASDTAAELAARPRGRAGPGR